MLNAYLTGFCNSSGQRINKANSKLFCYMNVSHSLSHSLGVKFRYAVTNNLRKYLGIPLIHGRVTKATYRKLIDNINRKLNGWKAKTLLFPGRVTLAQSTFQTMPSYTMQMAYVPPHTCNEIDKKIRSIVWGSWEDSKKGALVKWDSICGSKDDGGPGLRKASDLNSAFLMKFTWDLIARPEALWLRVLCSKYKTGQGKLPVVKRKNSTSNIWKGICLVWEQL